MLFLSNCILCFVWCCKNVDVNIFESVFIILVIVGIVVLDIFDVIECVLFVFVIVIILNILIMLVMVFNRFKRGYNVIIMLISVRLLFSCMLVCEIIVWWICFVF